MTNINLAALRAVLRLKAGLSPTECLDEITVDFARHRPFLNEFFNSTTKGMAAVVGPYGTGKTHFLQLAKQEALKRRFAVAALSQETGTANLSFPHRHMQVILGGLRAPDPVGPVLQYAATLIEAQPSLFREQVNEVVAEKSELSRIRSELELIFLYGPENMRSSRALEYLSGASLAFRNGSGSNRLHAYRLLEFWLAYLSLILNCKGAVLLIDEMEGLYSGALYWSIRSRRTAYRSLGYYASLHNRIRLLGAFTPDGWYKVQEDIQDNGSYLTDQSSIVPGEDVPSLLRMLRSTKPHELSTFSEKNSEHLCNNLKRLHAIARGYQPPVNGEIKIGRSDLSPRLFSRSVISALEALWLDQQPN